jgi:hypothetical protein
MLANEVNDTPAAIALLYMGKRKRRDFGSP